MKKYMCIKSYPHGPSVGKVIHDSWEGEPRSLANYPEYWEEVAEVKYEILSFKRQNSEKFGNNLFKVKDENGLYCWDYTNSKNTVEELLAKDGFSVYSVKRTTDGEIFTIGDPAKTVTSKGNHKIASFNVSQKCTHRNSDGSWAKDGIDRIWVGWDKDAGGNWLEAIEHYRPLFQTVDGVNIYKWDTFYIVNKFFRLQQCSGGEYQNEKWQSYRFSTKEKAEEYIINNKPCLSFNDIDTMWEKTSIYRSSQEKYLKELIRERL